MKNLLALVEKHLGARWVDVSEWLRKQNSLDAIEQRLLAGDYDGLIREIDAAAKRFAAETYAQFLRAGQDGSRWLDEQLPDKLVRFDVNNQRAIKAAQRNELELVRGLAHETRQKVNQILVDGTRASANPRVMARDIRDSIGLTPYQEQIVRNYRRALEMADWDNALGRQLSHGQADRTVRRLARDGGELAPEQIDKMVEQYRQNWIGYRAETIARTEAGRNVHAGIDEAMRQATERGDIDAEQLQVEWIHAGHGANSRPRHAALDGKTVPWGKMFDVNGTPMRYPHDPAAPPSETANCRCTYATTIDDTRPRTETRPAADEKPPVPIAPAKNPKRVAAAQAAAAASVERRREIHSAARSNLPPELQSTWDREGHKFMRQESARIRGVKDRVNAASTLSQAFAEMYGSGAETMFGNEGDRYHVRAEIEAKFAEEWADAQERKYYEQAQAAYDRGEFDERGFAPPKTTSDDDPPF